MSIAGLTCIQKSNQLLFKFSQGRARCTCCHVNTVPHHVICGVGGINIMKMKFHLCKSVLLLPVLGQLLPLLHGNVNSSKMIITEFQEFCRQQTAPTTSPSELSSPQNSPENIPTR